MFSTGIALIRKDLTLLFFRGNALIQALLLGLILIFVFSLAQSAGETLSPQTGACIFWLCSLFCTVLLFNQLFALEEGNAQRLALVLLPTPIHTIFLSKALSGLMLLLTSQLCFLPATVAFLGQSIVGDLAEAALALILVDFGLITVGALLGALAQGQAAKETLLTIVLFPLLTPLLLAGISIHTATLSVQAQEPTQWFSLAFAFDALFFGAALLLFPFIYSGEE